MSNGGSSSGSSGRTRVGSNIGGSENYSYIANSNNNNNNSSSTPVIQLKFDLQVGNKPIEECMMTVPAKYASCARCCKREIRLSSQKQ